MSHEEKRSVTKPLAHCEACCTLFVSAARFIDETRDESDESQPPSAERRRRFWITFAVAAVLMIILLLVIIVLGRDRTPDATSKSARPPAGNARRISLLPARLELRVETALHR